MNTKPSFSKNSNGGVLVSEKDLLTFFKFIDVIDCGKLNVANMKNRLGPLFHRNLTTKECRSLMNGGTGINLPALRTLLADNRAKNFDPVREAFAMFDPRGSGRADAGAVRTILEHVGAHGRLSEEDLKVAIGAASDGSGGGIGLEDLRRVMGAAGSSSAPCCSPDGIEK